VRAEGAGGEASRQTHNVLKCSTASQVQNGNLVEAADRKLTVEEYGVFLTLCISLLAISGRTLKSHQQATYAAAVSVVYCAWAVLHLI
jgi:hypothetical protein